MPRDLPENLVPFVGRDEARAFQPKLLSRPRIVHAKLALVESVFAMARTVNGAWNVRGVIAAAFMK